MSLNFIVARAAKVERPRQIRLSGASLVLRTALLVAIFFAMSPLAFAQSLLAVRSATSGPSDVSGQPEAEASLSPRTPLKPERQFVPYVPITPRQRFRWFISCTFGPSHVVGGVLSSALGTASDRPVEYGPHWGGFADRYGMRLTGVVPQNAMEAGLGFVLGEDPRYFSARGLPFKARLGNVIRLTFVARRVDGSYGPAYARYAAISGNNLLSNAWRVHSEANAQDVLARTAGGLVGRMIANAFEEFWPSVKDHVSPRR